MSKCPKIKYRKSPEGFIRFKSAALPYDSIEEAEESFYYVMGRIKACAYLRYFRSGQLLFHLIKNPCGEHISWDYLLELLEWLDITTQDLDRYIAYEISNGIYDVIKYEVEWYKNLKEEAYGKR